jgi:uncharacterized membrane protein
VKVFKVWGSIRTGLWFVPVMCVLGGVALSFATIAVDRHFDFELIPAWLTGGPDAAIAILSTVAASMVSLAALVLTITMVVVQLAMGQFSPRIVQTILQDKPSQLAIGTSSAPSPTPCWPCGRSSSRGKARFPAWPSWLPSCWF